MCSHNTMIANDSPTHAWKCAACGYIYGKSTTCQELEARLEYAYRCIENGFVHGNFDFTVLRRDASNYLADCRKARVVR